MINRNHLPGERAVPMAAGADQTASRLERETAAGAASPASLGNDDRCPRWQSVLLWIFVTVSFAALLLVGWLVWFKAREF